MIRLPNHTSKGVVAASSFTSADTLSTVPSNAVPWAKFVCRHIGTSGFWYGCYGGDTPTTSNYDFKLGPSEEEPNDNPPIGAINMLSSSSSIGNLEYTISWRA